MRAGGGLISAGYPLRWGWLAIAAAQGAGRHAPGRGRRSTALNARQLLCVELAGYRIGPGPPGHSAPRCLAVNHPLVPHFRGHRRCWCWRWCRGRGRGARWRSHRGAGLRPYWRGDRKGGNDRDAIQEMLHASILCGSSGLEQYAATARRTESDPCGPRAWNNHSVASFPRIRNFECRVSDLAAAG